MTNEELISRLVGRTIIAVDGVGGQYDEVDYRFGNAFVKWSHTRLVLDDGSCIELDEWWDWISPTRDAELQEAIVAESKPVTTQDFPNAQPTPSTPSPTPVPSTPRPTPSPTPTPTAPTPKEG